METLIEPGIRPLVDALNATALVQTFSSCEGHFTPGEQTLVDRTLAYVRFVPGQGVSDGAVEQILGTWLLRFKKKHGLVPVRLVGYKLFTPTGDDTLDTTFVLELHPFNRFDRPETKRADLDRAILQLAGLIG